MLCIQLIKLKVCRTYVGIINLVLLLFCPKQKCLSYDSSPPTIKICLRLMIGEAYSAKINTLQVVRSLTNDSLLVRCVLLLLY